VAAAEAMSAHRGDLGLALPEIPADTAAALAKHRGDLHLALKTLESRPLAAKLARQRSPGLTTLTSLSVEAARELARREADLDLSGLRRLPAGVAGELAACKVGVRLAGLESVTAADLAALGAAHVYLDGRILATSDDETRAALLAQRTLHFDYRRLTTLTPEIARAIVAREKRLDLAGITSFAFPQAVEVAAVLARFPGPLALPGLKSISANALSALIRKEDVEIPLLETLEIMPEPDGVPSEDIVVPPGFAERQERRRNR
jgi:hypothetical protein